MKNPDDGAKGISRSRKASRARPPGAPQQPQRKKLYHDIPLRLRPEDEIFFITICCKRRPRNQLCRPKVALAIFASVEFRNRNRFWYAHFICLMPDHLHALISFLYKTPIAKIIADWKRYLATKLKINWRRDFFDHRLRKEESYREKEDYIRANPVRAGLMREGEEWPYFWTAEKHPPTENHAVLGAPGGRALPVLLSMLMLLSACRTDMNNQPRAKPLSESDFFPDHTSARPLPAHVVPFGEPRTNSAFYTGLTNGFYVTQLPIKLTPELLKRGQERFNAICSECHDHTGSGNGMIVQRGFPQPPSFHVPRLRNAPIGHFYDVITNGYGVMYSYATRVEPEDRWAIAAYIRALQISHNVRISDVNPNERAKLEAR